MSVWLIIGIVAIVVLGAISLLGRSDESGNLPAVQDNSADQYSGEAAAPTDTYAPAKQSSAGTSLGVAPFSKAAYDRAVADGKVVILFANTDTCGSSCVKEIGEMKAAFAKYPERPIAGFIVDLNKEQAFMNSLNVFGPDGKAVIVGGAVKTRTPLGWLRDDYAKYIEIYTDGPEDYE